MLSVYMFLDTGGGAVVITVNEVLSTKFLTEIDFCSAGVIQGLVLNLNLYLLTYFKGL